MWYGATWTINNHKYLSIIIVLCVHNCDRCIALAFKFNALLLCNQSQEMGAGTLSFQISQAGLLSRERQVSFHLCCVCLGLRTCSSPLISTLIWSLMEPETEDRSDLFSRWYHTSISPDRVRTSMIVCPRKSSLSRVSFCRSRAFRSLSSSQTRTLMRSLELWHSLKQW